MKIGVIGAGAVGGYFGGRLARAGVDVTFLVRPSRAEQLLEDGLVVRSVHGDFTVTPHVTVAACDLASCDVILIAVKNYHLPEVEGMLPELLAGHAMLLPLLNGVSHMTPLRTRAGEERLLGGSCYIEVTLSAKGHVIQTSEVQDIVFGALQDEPSARVASVLVGLSDAFARAEIPAFARPHIIREMWKKYIFLCAFSGSTAAARIPIGEVMRREASRHVYATLVSELIAVAQGHGVDISSGMQTALLERAQGLSPDMTSSLHRDLEKGLPLELDSLQGALIHMAKEKGIAVPVHETIYGILAPYRKGKRVPIVE